VPAPSGNGSHAVGLGSTNVGHYSFICNDDRSHPLTRCRGNGLPGGRVIGASSTCLLMGVPKENPMAQKFVGILCAPRRSPPLGRQNTRSIHPTGRAPVPQPAPRANPLLVQRVARDSLRQSTTQTAYRGGAVDDPGRRFPLRPDHLDSTQVRDRSATPWGYQEVVDNCGSPLVQRSHHPPGVVGGRSESVRLEVSTGIATTAANTQYGLVDTWRATTRSPAIDSGSGPLGESFE